MELVGNIEDPSLVEKLIKRGARVNEIDEHNKLSAIFFIGTNNFVGDLKVLLNAGADLSIKDKMGRTPLEFFKELGNIKIVEIIGNGPELVKAAQEGNKIKV